MPGTKTLYLDFRRFQRGPEVDVVLGLMIAANDVALANRGLAYYSKEQTPLRKHAQVGARRYFVMLQCGHLNEGLLLVEKVRDSVELAALVRRTSTRAQTAYARLLACLRGGAEHKKFKKYIGSIRNRLIFHYDPAAISRALSDRASRPASATGNITLGTDISLWRFNMADDIVDSIICRDLWNIPRTADLRLEADRIIDYCHTICVDFMDFSSEFAVQYAREYAST